MTAAEERVYYNENTIQNLLSRLIEMAAIQLADAAADSSVCAAATDTLADPPKIEFQEGRALTTTPSTGGAGGQGEVPTCAFGWTFAFATGGVRAWPRSLSKSRGTA